MQVLKDLILCHAWLYTQAKQRKCCLLGSNALQWFRTRAIHTQDTFIWEVSFGFGIIRGMWMQFALSTSHPVFHQSRALNRGVFLTPGKSSSWQSVSVVSCKQPCGVMPHLPQDLALPWEGDTSTLNGGKIEIACFDKILFCRSYAEEKSYFIWPNLLWASPWW